jgi:predicted NAD/FAD-dependent oxidoreductase
MVSLSDKQESKMKTAIIGAGIAGLTVARTLSMAGYEVTVFDKSKGTGGRLSSRSYQGGWIDHGAPYLSVELKSSCDFLSEHVPTGNLQKWSPQVRGHLCDEEKVNAIGVPRNSAITRGLLGDQQFQPSTRIARLDSLTYGWHLYNDGDSCLGEWPLVVLAVPAPQAMMLLKDHPLFSESLKMVHMEPSWVAAIRTDNGVDQWADVSVFEHPVIRRIVNNSSKPQRGATPVYLVQAQKSWSEQFLEFSPEAAGRQLLASFTELAGGGQGHELLFAHRWRYALAEKPLGSPFLWDGRLQLGVCGDWCLGRRVEDALRSGADLAAHILEQLSGGSQ